MVLVSIQVNDFALDLRIYRLAVNQELICLVNVKHVPDLGI